MAQNNDIEYLSANSIANSWNIRLVEEISTELTLRAQKSYFNKQGEVNENNKTDFLSFIKTAEDTFLFRELLNACKKGSDKANFSIKSLISENDAQTDNSIITDTQTISKKLSLQAAEECTVLLKNDNNILPLAASAKVAIIGHLAAVENNGFSSFKQEFLQEKSLPFTCSGFADGYNFSEQRNDELIIESCTLANSSDSVLLFLGFNDKQTENMQDNKSLKLPVNQLALTDALIKTGKNIIAIICSDIPIEVSFDERCAAILLIPSGVAYQYKSLVNILSGKVNPSGKLSFSLYDNQEEIFDDLKKLKDLGQIKDWDFFGYRYYDTAGINVKYPFGHGLSYTKFSYSSIKADAIGVQFRIKNTGKYAGWATIQLYIGKNQSNIARPLKELQGFSKVYLKSGESRNISISLYSDNFYIRYGKEGGRKIEDGEYTAYIAESVADVRLQKSFYVSGVKFSEDTKNNNNLIPTKSNIASGGYTMKNNNTNNTNISKANLLYIGIILLAAFFDIIISVIGNFNSVIIIMLIILNLLIPFAIVGIVHESRKRKEKYLLEVKTRKAAIANEVQVENEKALEEMFLEEFSKNEQQNAHATSGVSYTLNVNTQADMSDTVEESSQNSELLRSENLDIKTVAAQLTDYLKERGILPEASSVRAVIAAMFATRTILLKCADFILLSELITHVSNYFGTWVRFDNGGVMNSTNKNTVSIIALDSGLESSLQSLDENEFVINVKLRKVKKKNEITEKLNINYLQFIKICENSEKYISISESLFKKLDRVEDYVNSVAPYHIDNKEWRSIEKFIAIYLDCGGTEDEAGYCVVSAKLLAKIAPIIKSDHAAKESDFSFMIKKIFG